MISKLIVGEWYDISCISHQFKEGVDNQFAFGRYVGYKFDTGSRLHRFDTGVEIPIDPEGWPRESGHNYHVGIADIQIKTIKQGKRPFKILTVWD